MARVRSKAFSQVRSLIKNVFEKVKEKQWYHLSDLKRFGEPRLFQSSFRCSITSLSTLSGCMLGTILILNLPITLAGITVFAPAPLNAPSMPENYYHLL